MKTSSVLFKLFLDVPAFATESMKAGSLCQFLESIAGAYIM